MSKKNKKNNNGFSLVETLVALFIFSVSILSVMSVLSQGISSTNFAKNKLTAGYLSQEGIEYFRNMRDTLQLYKADPNVGWVIFVSNLESHGCASTGCYFDNDESDIEWGGSMPIGDLKIYTCGDTCPNFFYSTSSGKFNYTSGETSSFSRKMLVKKIDNDNIKVTSIVGWKSGSQVGSVSFSENLSNWIE